jgi:hypothetical protein
VKPIATAPNQPVAGGSIKGHRVFAEKLDLFEPGTTYEIEYTETTSNGVTDRSVKPATAVAPAVAFEAEAVRRVLELLSPRRGRGPPDPS